jgi:acyl-CoA reductase-like NAD-dependent aldehyde dehydrogenase
VWTKDIKKVINTARALRAGIVWINDTQLEKKSIYINLAE